VGHWHAGLFERARHENGPVAIERLAFGAHERDSVLPHSRQQAIDTGAKDLRGSQFLVLTRPSS